MATDEELHRDYLIAKIVDTIPRGFLEEFQKQRQAPTSIGSSS